MLAGRPHSAYAAFVRRRGEVKFEWFPVAVFFGATLCTGIEPVLSRCDIVHGHRAHTFTALACHSRTRGGAGHEALMQIRKALVLKHKTLFVEIQGSSCKEKQTDTNYERRALANIKISGNISKKSSTFPRESPMSSRTIDKKCCLLESKWKIKYDLLRN